MELQELNSLKTANHRTILSPFLALSPTNFPKYIWPRIINITYSAAQRYFPLRILTVGRWKTL
jgi:hypothetical protein